MPTSSVFHPSRGRGAPATRSTARKPPSWRSNQIERSPSSPCQRRSTGRPQHAAVERLHRGEIADLDRDVVDAVRTRRWCGLGHAFAPILRICFHSAAVTGCTDSRLPRRSSTISASARVVAQLRQRHDARELGVELDVDRVPARIVARAVAIEVPVARIELGRVGVAGADDFRACPRPPAAPRSSDRRARRRRRRCRCAGSCGPGSCAPRPSGSCRPWRAPGRRWRTRWVRTSSTSTGPWPRFLPSSIDDSEAGFRLGNAIDP